MRKKILIVIILTIFLLHPLYIYNSNGYLVDNIEKNNELYIEFFIENHSPIYIECNEDFTFENGVVGGSGIETDPFVIEGWHILENDNTEYGIKINNTDAFFLIKNCSFDSSIINCFYIMNAENGFVENIETNGNFIGVNIRYCCNIQISNCIFRNNINQFAYGLTCAWSSNISITGCEFSNKYKGINILEVCNIKIENVISHNNLWEGIEIYGDDIKYITINNCIISNNGWSGIQVISAIQHNGYVHISDCIVFDNALPQEPGSYHSAYGISVYDLGYTIIENCTIYHNSNGIALGGCDYSVIKNCEVYEHLTISGIAHTGINICSKYATVINCDIYDNDNGIGAGNSLPFYRDCKYITIEKNNIFDNNWNGIMAGFWTFTIKINHNNIYNNSQVNESSYGGLCAILWGLLDARFNWWGSENGPKTLLHQSDGDRVVRIRSWAFIRLWLTEPIPDAGILN